MMLYAGLAAAPPAFNHAGTPPGITHSFDCAARKAAYSFGQALLPGRGDFKTLFQALQLQACNMSTPAVMDEYRPPTYGPPAGAALYVDPHGDDANPGTLERPLRSIAAAVARSAGKASGPLGATILLRGGTHYTPETVEIGPEHSGLTIQNYQVGLGRNPNPNPNPTRVQPLELTSPYPNPNPNPNPHAHPRPNYQGEHAVVSGAVPLSIPQSAWAPHKLGSGRWLVAAEQNNVHGRAQVTSRVNHNPYPNPHPNPSPNPSPNPNAARS